MELKKLLNTSLEKVDKEIISRLDSTVPLLSKIGSHLIKVKGKRVRPLLTLAMAAQLNDFSRNTILLATAVEFIHTATLLHDDVVDQSNLRRGVKAANVIWGNEACAATSMSSSSVSAPYRSTRGSIRCPPWSTYELPLPLPSSEQRRTCPARLATTHRASSMCSLQACTSSTR